MNHRSRPPPSKRYVLVRPHCIAVSPTPGWHEPTTLSHQVLYKVAVSGRLGFRAQHAFE